MEADNLRPSYVYEAQLLFERCRKTFPEAKTPADITHAMANEYKRRRAEEELSSWSVKSDLATLRAVFGKWLGRELGLLASNPFANVKPPKCDDPDVRIVSAAESKALFDWLGVEWNNWRLPIVYLEVASLLGWRATEVASIREEDLLPDGYVRVAAENCKTRRHKYGWLPPNLYADLQACAAGGWAFGRFSDELRRLLMLWKRQPNHASMVMDFAPKRLVGWLQDELKRFNDDREGELVYLARLPADCHYRPANGRGVREGDFSNGGGIPRGNQEALREVGPHGDCQAVCSKAFAGRWIGQGCRSNCTHLARLLRAEGNSALDGNEKFAANYWSVTCLAEWRNGRRSGFKIPWP